MRLVRFGKRVINMAQVVEIEYRAEYKDVHFYSPETYRLYTNQGVDSLPNWLEIDGADMIALEQWLKDNSDDARAPMMEEDLV